MLDGICLQGNAVLMATQEAKGLPMRKPPVGAATRWAGVLPQLAWAVEQRPALDKYTISPADSTCKLDDGTTYTDHALCPEEWDILVELVRPGPCLAAAPTLLVMPSPSCLQA